jgi:signal transduction histidine kinase
VSLPPAPLRIRHDPQRIGQVVANLVGNGLKFTQPGGTVAVVVRPVADGAQIEVSDTGVGIDPIELPRIFERFYRGSRANEARSSGSGLGLAIVKSIVDMHAGRVAVESSIGSGTTFTVSLPADPRTVATTDEPAAEPGPAAPIGDRAGADVAPAPAREMADSSPTQAPSLNLPPSP